MEPFQTEEQQKYERARKRVEELKGFYGHLSAYVVINIFLMTINLIQSPNNIWFYWTTGGWGIGVIFHAIKVFNYSPFLGKDWEARKMREFIEREEEKRKQF